MKKDESEFQLTPTEQLPSRTSTSKLLCLESKVKDCVQAPPGGGGGNDAICAFCPSILLITLYLFMRTLCFLICPDIVIV
jgi:hypothetical protein